VSCQPIATRQGEVRVIGRSCWRVCPHSSLAVMASMVLVVACGRPADIELPTSGASHPATDSDSEGRTSPPSPVPDAAEPSSADTTEPTVLTTAPAVESWDARYKADGHIIVGTTRFASPESFDLTLLDDLTLDLTGVRYEQGRPAHIMAMQLLLTDRGGTGVRHIWVSPPREGGSTTYGLPLDGVLPFRSLAVGQLAEASVLDGEGHVRVRRPADGRWQIEVLGEGDFELTLDLAADPADPPWERLVIEISGNAPQGRVSGSLRLVRIDG